MINKKTLVLAIGISWALTLVTVLLISNFAPSLTQPFTQQFTESNSVKVVTLKKQEIMSFPEIFSREYPHLLRFNFTAWYPSNPSKNSIVALFCSFEYSSDEPLPNAWENEIEIDWNLRVRIDIDKFIYINDPIISKTARNIDEWNQQWSSDWETATFQIAISSDRINQNQNQYPIKLAFAHDGDASAYIRNVNLMLLVIDG